MVRLARKLPLKKWKTCGGVDGGLALKTKRIKAKPNGKHATIGKVRTKKKQIG